MDDGNSVLRALLGYSKSQIKKKRATKNQKPEAAVVAQIQQWCYAQGWQVQRIESKNTFNPKAGRWISSPTTPGTPDIIGTLPSGVFVAIEVKAPGKLKTLRDNQREFILQKISSNAFCIVTDSVARLEKIYNHWRTLSSLTEKREFLLTQMP